MIDLLFRKVLLAAEEDMGLGGAGTPCWETVAACWEGMEVIWLEASLWRCDGHVRLGGGLGHCTGRWSAGWGQGDVQASSVGRARPSLGAAVLEFTSELLKLIFARETCT